LLSIAVLELSFALFVGCGTVILFMWVGRKLFGDLGRKDASAGAVAVGGMVVAASLVTREVLEPAGELIRSRILLGVPSKSVLFGFPLLLFFLSSLAILLLGALSVTIITKLRIQDEVRAIRHDGNMPIAIAWAATLIAIAIALGSSIRTLLRLIQPL